MILHPTRPTIWHSCLAGIAVAATSIGATAHAEPTIGHHAQPGLYDFQFMARSSVFDPLLIQARNGQVLDQTLWNYQFTEGKDDLLSSGHYVLDRLARRAGHGLLELHLQTARDLEYNRQRRDSYVKIRSDLDFKRVQAIVDYMLANHADVTFTVRIIDPAPVGTSGLEATRSLREVNNTSIGVLPRELLQALGTYLPNANLPSTPGAEAPSTPSSAGTAPTSGTFGAEATQGGAQGGAQAGAERP